MSPNLLLGASEPDDGGVLPPSLNRGAVLALFGGAAVAALALFSMPTLVDAGMTPRQAFILISVVEFLSAVVCGLAVHWLYLDREE